MLNIPKSLCTGIGLSCVNHDNPMIWSCKSDPVNQDQVHAHLLFCPWVMPDSLQPCELQHVRLPCPSLPPRVCSNSCMLSWWCHPIISSSVTPFSSCPSSFPASGSFPVSQLFASSGQRIGASASVLSMNIQNWFPLELTGWSSCYPRDSQESSPATQFRSISSLALSLLYGPTLTWLVEIP